MYKVNSKNTRTTPLRMRRMLYIPLVSPKGPSISARHSPGLIVASLFHSQQNNLVHNMHCLFTLDNYADQSIQKNVFLNFQC